MSANKDIKDRVRQKFLKFYETNTELYHEYDIENIRQNDWPIERFVLVNSNEDKALQSVIKAMQWRKSFGIHNFNDQYFPYEIYKINLFYQFGCDKEDRPIFWSNIRNLYVSNELNHLLKQYWSYQIEKIDRQTSHQGWLYINDQSGSGLSNMNIEFSNSVTEMLQNYWPRAFKNMLNVELPWILNAASKIWLTFINDEMKSVAKFIKKEELVNYVDKDVIPVHLGGYNSRLFNEIPDGVKRLDQMSHLGLTSKQIEKIYSTFKCLKEN